MPALAPLRVLVPATRVPLGARTLFGFNWGSKTSKEAAESTEAPADSKFRSITELLKRSPRATTVAQEVPKRGDLAESSLFAEEEKATAVNSEFIDLETLRKLRDPERHNWGWLKKVAQRDHRKRGRLTRQEKIAQTEREHTAASHFIKTSMKKLAPLARQIAGKSVEDAIVQMRFSPKKAAKSVLKHLYYTRDEAILRKGLKSEEMYISQAWVGRGPFDRGLNHRARGRIDMLKLPYTSITLNVKEQATLDRIAREKQAKKDRKPAQQILPNRAIRGQRQYYTW
ncbi:ribosomal protein L22/L17 [Pyronema omphalodes]|nr:ribosomal protein L22/L17 [Pyronema omphalodes]